MEQNNKQAPSEKNNQDTTVQTQQHHQAEKAPLQDAAKKELGKDVAAPPANPALAQKPSQDHVKLAQ